MTDRNIPNLSRRRILGSLGALGVGAALGGAGTTAFFSDEEEYTDNQLVAGSLDMKVSWAEHYYYGSGDVLEGLEYDPVTDLAAIPAETREEDWVPLPDPEYPFIWVHGMDLGTFMANTLQEQFPEGGLGYRDPCEVLADVPDILEKPVIELDDIKPGDFGEVTFDFALCENPGYVWLTGELIEALENEVNEPEGKDPQEESDLVELLDAIRTVWWYDSRGDNVIQTDCTEDLYLTDSGTDPTTLFSVDLVDGDGGKRAELTELWPDEGESETDFDQTDAIAATLDGQLIYFYDKTSGHLGYYDTVGDEFVDWGPVSGDPGGVVLAGFSPDGSLWAASQDTDNLYTVDLSGPTAVDRGDTGIDLQGADLAFASDGTLYIWTSSDAVQGLYKVDEPGLDPTAVPLDESNIGGLDARVTGLAIRNAGTGDLVASDRENDEIVIVDRLDGSIVDRYPMILDGEPYAYDYGDMTVGALCGEVFHRGTLGADLDALGTGLGIPLDGNRATPFDEIQDDPASPNRECFVPGIAHYIGFAWYLPVDHANEIQTDSVAFDLGFYTEQCRHNDGSGLSME